MGLQGKIQAKGQEKAALKSRRIGYLANEGKGNGITIAAKNNETAEHPFISIFGQHGYRRHKFRVLLAHKQGGTLFTDAYIPNSIVTFNL